MDKKRLRKKAEKILSEKKATPHEGFGDLDKLIHEFEVHQVELEMQNDELRKAQAEIEGSRSRYVELYDFAPIGYFTLDHRGVIVEANLTGARLLGVERGQLLKTPFSFFVMPEDRNLFRNFQRKGFQIRGMQSCELRLNSKADHPLWVHLEGAAVEASEGDSARMRVTASDISERKQIEDALRAAAEIKQAEAERKNTEERILRQNAVLDGINRIFKETLSSRTVEELGQTCLSVTEEVTGSKFGFIAEIGPDGLLYNIALSNPGWELCALYDKTGPRRPPGNFKIHGLYGRVLKDGKSLIANQPSSHPDSIGVPEGHPPLTAFLGVPLIQDGKTFGIIALGNREGGFRDEDRDTLEELAPAIVESLSRKRAEEALREIAERFRVAIAESPITVYQHDRDLRFTWVYNPPPGFSAGDFLGKKMEEVYTPEDAARLIKIKGEVLVTGKGRRGATWLTLKGKLRFLDFSVEPLRDGSGRIVGVTCATVDNTAHKRAEEALRKAKDELEERVQERTEELAKSQQRLQQLASQLLLAQERERKRVAVELHDGLLSELAATKYLLEGKLILLDKGTPVDADGLKRIADILGVTMKEARRIMNNLHPSVLDELGFLSAMNWLCGEYQKSYPHISVQTEIAVSETDISDGIRIVIFRVLQEAMNNFAKHGKGDRVEVSLSKSDGAFSFVIRDNGQGFDVEKAERGLGLESMRERVELSGGEFQIESAVGQGTTIRAIWRS